MDFGDISYYRVNKLLLSVLGHWPLQTPWEMRLHRTAIVLGLGSIIIPEVIKFVEEVVGGADLDTLFQSIPPLGLHVINIIKWINCVVKMDKSKDMLVIMKDDWQSRDKQMGSDILHDYAERGRVIAVGYTGYMYVSSLLYVCLPLIPLFLDVVKPLNESRPQESLFRTEYFIDQDRYFLLIFLHAFITTFMSLTIVCAFDCMYGTYIQYACALFSELCDQLENGAEDTSDSLEQLHVSKEDDLMYHNIVKCVKMHKKAVEFYNILESTYTTYFLVMTGGNILIMSFTGLQTVMKLHEVELAMRYFCFTLGQIAHVLFFTWHGQMIIDHSMRVYEAIYNSPWCGSSFRTRRLLIFMMMRSANPCKLTGGRLFFISLETFTTILKTSMSYFTVLTSLKDSE